METKKGRSVAIDQQDDWLRADGSEDAKKHSATTSAEGLKE